MTSKKIGREWLPLVVVSTLGLCSVPTLPIWLAQATERFQLTALHSGVLASIELACVAVASMVWAGLSASLRSRAGLILALAIVSSVIGNLGSFLADTPFSLAASRVLVGLAYGLALSEITRRAAQLPDPHRIFAVQQFGLVLFTVIYFPTVPRVIAAFGPSSPFLFNAALGVCALAAVLWAPSPAEDPRSEVIPSQSATLPVQTATTAVALAFAAIGLSFMAQGSLWTYITMAAANSGLGIEDLGKILAVGAVLNVIAPLAAGRLGLRLGRAVPLLMGYASLGFSIALVAFGFGPIWFAVGAVGLSMSLLFLIPFLLGTLAGLDASGRSASAGPAFFMIGGAIGPILGGVAIGIGGFALLGAIGALATACAFGLALAAGSRTLAKEQGQTAPG